MMVIMIVIMLRHCHRLIVLRLGGLLLAHIDLPVFGGYLVGKAGLEPARLQ